MLRMTDDAVAALPDELGSIVLCDRELEAIRAAAVPSVARFREVRANRADWTKGAIARWGHTSRGDGPGRKA
ncbi:hypothetical protein [Lichenihabitans psoromatis]|uniref:hypothetical protein n=1 Tax=Lichenihabitans psoromatis TaxID=2528642 RepID=UPI001035EB93|nr:hypothetical protein [Lichenihabitans psoromatis]